MLTRRGSPEDGPALAAVFVAARAEMTYLPDLHTLGEHLVYWSRQLGERHSLVALASGQIVAFAIYDAGWLHHLYVRPASQQHGLGSALLRQVQSAMPAGVELWTFQPNLRARRFYERHGFECVEVTDGAANEERVPDARYRWKPCGSSC